MGVCMSKILGSGTQLSKCSSNRFIVEGEREDAEYLKRVFYLHIKGLWGSLGKRDKDLGGYTVMTLCKLDWVGSGGPARVE